MHKLGGRANGMQQSSSASVPTPWSIWALQIMLLKWSHASGVVGVTTTGYLLHYASGRAGWWAAFSLSSVLCLLGSFLFTSCAQGKHIFGEHV